MVTIHRKSHWEAVYTTKGGNSVSWYQREPLLSLELIRSIAPPSGGRIIDIGGGASVLVDGLLHLSFEKVAVLDISEIALDIAKSRLGERAGRVEWISADITEAGSVGTFDIWHDRAVFHFLTAAVDRTKYLELARRTVPVGGHLIIATFADDGPKECSGLDVCGYNGERMKVEFNNGFSLISESKELHVTPWGSSQAFFYGILQRHS